jgi:hypothetical protein
LLWILEDIKRVKSVSLVSGVVDVFRYTAFGYFFAWIAESFSPTKRERANEEIFEQRTRIMHCRTIFRGWWRDCIIRSATSTPDIVSRIRGV